MRTNHNGARVGRGDPCGGLDFYNLLHEDGEFCTALGRAVLAAGRLEAAVTSHLRRHVPNANTERAPLGKLVHYAEQQGLLTDLTPALRHLATQRNYLAHKVYALFAGSIEETILPRSNLIDSDVWGFTERAWLLANDLDAVAALVDKATLGLRTPPNIAMEPTARN